MPAKRNWTHELTRSTLAHRRVRLGGVPARTAIQEFGISNADDIRDLRKFAATRDIENDIPAPRAIILNEVEDEDDRHQLRMSAARRAIHKGVIAAVAIETHGIVASIDKVAIIKHAISKDMEAGKSAVEAAQRHNFPQKGYLFRQLALKGALMDVQRGRTAQGAFERNKVTNESTADNAVAQIFRAVAENNKRLYLRSWLKSTREEQRASHLAKASESRRAKSFHFVETQPTAAYVDLNSNGAWSMISAGKSGPEIVTELGIDNPSHIAEIKWKCARRDFEGHNVNGELTGKKTSALYALRRNRVEDRDHAEYLLRDEVDRSVEKKLRQWHETRLKADKPALAQSQKENKRTDEELLTSAKQNRRIDTPITRSAIVSRSSQAVLASRAVSNTTNPPVPLVADRVEGQINRLRTYDDRKSRGGLDL